MYELYVSLRDLRRFFFSPSPPADALGAVFFAALPGSVFAGALEAVVDAGALEAVAGALEAGFLSAALGGILMD